MSFTRLAISMIILFLALKIFGSMNPKNEGEGSIHGCYITIDGKEERIHGCKDH